MPYSGVPLLDRLERSIKAGAPNECWPWTGYKNTCGYGMIRDGRRRRGAHRAYYENTIGPVPAHLEVMHRCDNPACCNPAHLTLGTHADNMADMAQKGRATGRGKRGEECNLAKLTAREANEIRAIVGWPQHEIGRLYSISQTAISHIIRRKTWI